MQTPFEMAWLLLKQWDDVNWSQDEGEPFSWDVDSAPWEYREEPMRQAWQRLAYSQSPSPSQPINLEPEGDEEDIPLEYGHDEVEASRTATAPPQQQMDRLFDAQSRGEKGFEPEPITPTSRTNDSYEDAGFGFHSNPDVVEGDMLSRIQMPEQRDGYDNTMYRNQ